MRGLPRFKRPKGRVPGPWVVMTFKLRLKALTVGRKHRRNGRRGLIRSRVQHPRRRPHGRRVGFA
jgi:hypothetical protein